MNEKLIDRLRNGTDMPALDDEAFRWYAEITDEAADALESLSAECTEQARLLGMSAEREADLLGEIKRLERLAHQNSIAAREARHDERCAMSYLSEVRRIVGGDDYPDMVLRVEAMHGALVKAEINIATALAKALK